jgi:DNA-binding NarL/FixJ family response regulator
MDLSMPDLNGIEAMRRIHAKQPQIPVVILTAHADAGVEREARAAGASGFLAKGTPLDDIVLVLNDAAGTVEAGARWFSRPGPRGDGAGTGSHRAASTHRTGSS